MASLITQKSNFPSHIKLNLNTLEKVVAAELFCLGEETVSALILEVHSRSLLVRLYAPDFPDWLDTERFGLKLRPDARTIDVMEKFLDLVEKWLLDFEKQKVEVSEPKKWFNSQLNDSQKEAVTSFLTSDRIHVLHGYLREQESPPPLSKL